MSIVTNKLLSMAETLYPGTDDNVTAMRNAYIKGAIDGISLTNSDPSEDFFSTLAKSLRDLWPSGEKDGKYPWRDSVTNLVKRLKFIWNERDLKNKYSIEDCLVAGRKYLSQFEHNARYMQVLKYFIFKQNSIVASNGKVTYTYKSNFADLLEDNTLTVAADNDFSEFNVSSTFEQGELI